MHGCPPCTLTVEGLLTPTVGQMQAGTLAGHCNGPGQMIGLAHTDANTTRQFGDFLTRSSGFSKSGSAFACSTGGLVGRQRTLSQCPSLLLCLFS